MCGFEAPERGQDKGQIGHVRLGEMRIREAEVRGAFEEAGTERRKRGRGECLGYKKGTLERRGYIYSQHSKQLSCSHFVHDMFLKSRCPLQVW